ESALALARGEPTALALDLESEVPLGPGLKIVGPEGVGLGPVDGSVPGQLRVVVTPSRSAPSEGELRVVSEVADTEVTLAALPIGVVGEPGPMAGHGGVGSS